MKHFMKFGKFFSAIIAVAVVSATMSITEYYEPQLRSYAEEYEDPDVYFDGILSYTVYSDHVELTDCEDSVESVDIPSEYDGLPITVIKYAFQDCTSLTYVNIPDSVTEIGDCAFYGCTALKEIVIPDGVTHIGGSAFENAALTSVKIPSGVTEIGQGAFFECTALKAAELPDGLTKIGHYAFSGCTELSELNLPETVEAIGMDCFSLCTSLTEITLPVSVCQEPKINESEGYSYGGMVAWAFSGCTSLEKVNVPDGATYLGYSTFSSCTSLTEFTIPEGVKKIDNEMFSGCTSLKEITIPASVENMTIYAFNGCTSLTDITILNPDLFFGFISKDENGETVYDDSSADSNIPESTVIHGYENSTAQAFAEKYNRTFVSLGEAPPKIYGDVNNDKIFSVADVVLLQKWLLAVPNTHLSNWKMGDLNNDNRLDVFDLCLMKRMLLNS